MPSLIHEPERPKKPWRVDWRDRGRHRTKRFATRREAEAFQGDLARGTRQLDPSRLSLDAWWARWLIEHGIEWAPRTRRDRAWYGDRHVLPHLGHLRLGELERADVRRWRSDLVVGGASAYTVNTATTVLSACLGDAVEDGHLLSNPALGFRKLRRVVDPVRPPAVLHVEEVRARLDEPRDRLVVSLLAYAGLRPGEVCALTWAQITEVAAAVEHVGPAGVAGDGPGPAEPAAVGAELVVGVDAGTPAARAPRLLITRSRGVGGIKGTKTDRGRPVIVQKPLYQDLAAAQADHMERSRRDGDLLVSAGWDNWTGRVWRPACREAGHRIRPYDLRHLYASLLIAEGRLSLVEIAAQLGHSPAVLLRTYAHVIEASRGTAGQTLDSVVLGERHRLLGSESQSPSS